MTPDAVERMLIEWECSKVVHRYNLLNDAGRFEEAAALFAEDGAGSGSPRPSGLAAAPSPS